MTRSKKALVILGSPRKKGNSATLAGRVTAGLRAAGAEVESVCLYDMNFLPCTACNGCRGSIEKDCVLDDDMRGVFGKLRRADIWVIASPIYWFNVSGKMKLFMDRWYALGAPEGYGLEGKRMGVVLTYADADVFISGGVNALRTLQDSFNYMDAEFVGAVYGTANKPGEIREQRDLMQQAYQLGRKLVTG